MFQRVQEDGQLFSAHNVPRNILECFLLQGAIVRVYTNKKK